MQCEWASECDPANLNESTEYEGKRGRAAKKRGRDCGRQQEILDFALKKQWSSGRLFSTAPSWKPSMFSSCCLARLVSVQLRGHHPAFTILARTHTHTHWSNVFTWYGTKSVWKNQTAWREGVTGQRGCHVCVSVCWEQLGWNLQYKYTTQPRSEACV